MTGTVLRAKCDSGTCRLCPIGQNLIKRLVRNKTLTARLGRQGKVRVTCSSPQSGYLRSLSRLYLGEHVLKLLSGERHQEGGDDSSQLTPGHRHVVAGIEQLEGFFQFISFIGNFLK